MVMMMIITKMILYDIRKKCLGEYNTSIQPSEKNGSYYDDSNGDEYENDSYDDANENTSL